VTNAIPPGAPQLAGGRFGARVADLVASNVARTHANLAGVKRAVGATILEDFFDKVSGEIRETVGPFYGQLADSPHMPDHLKGLFRFMATGNGQWQSVLGGTLTGTVIGGGLGALITNELNPVVLPIVAANPHGLLSPSDCASAEARGLNGPVDMFHEAASSGINPDKFNVLVNLQRARFSPDQAAELVNRGMIDDTYGQIALTRQGFSPGEASMLMELRHTLLSPQELASLVNFGVLSEEEALPEARKSGTSDTDFHRLVLGAGQPPGVQDLMFAYRRGVIDKARLLRGIQQGPIRAEWFDVVESLGQVPMSTADAIEASVQGHLSKTEAQHIAETNGLLPDQFEPLWQTAGSPPGPHEMLDLLNRGLVSEADVTQALSESRLKNKYIPLLLKARFRLPTMVSTLSMVRKKIITEARGRDLLQQMGYLPDIADALIKNAGTTQGTTAKELTLAQIRELYVDRAITRDVALQRIEKLGYDAATAADELDLADERRAQRQVQAVVTRVHHEYVEGLLDQTSAAGYLHQLLLPADQVTTYLQLWEVERGTLRRTLTSAQVGQALKKGLISSDDAMARWSAMGYPPADVDILLALATPPPQAGP